MDAACQLSVIHAVGDAHTTSSLEPVTVRVVEDVQMTDSCCSDSSLICRIQTLLTDVFH